MSELPYLRWWVADALASTAHMDATEVGAYRLLLDHQWLSKGGRLPVDSSQLQRLARVYDPEDWERVWGVIGEKFEEDGGGLFNPRLEGEREEALVRRERRSRAGRAGAAKRWSGQPDSNRIAMPKQPHGEAMSRAYDYGCDDGEGGREGGGRRLYKPSSVEGVDEEDVGSDEGTRRSSSRYPAEFEEWWESYPRKVGKREAAKAWKQTRGERPATSEVIAVTEALGETEQWRKDGGSYVPYPATWLRRGGWEDDPGSLGGRSDGEGERGSITGAGREYDEAWLASLPEPE